MCFHKKKWKDDIDELAEKLQDHKQSGECHINYTGSSGGMEKAAAIDVWQRSEIKNCMRYVTFISDGDSSAYNAVRELSPYGEAHKIEKHGCVNHVAKRLTHRLEMIKQTTAVPQQLKSGKTRQMTTLGGHKKLTKPTIEKLTKYFGNNIRANRGKTVEIMKNDILSSYNHVTSSDAYPMHDLCPQGVDSRCFFNKSKALGLPIPSHETMKVRCQLNETQRDLVRNVYTDLCTPDLLSRCLLGKTQNPNESLHSKVWVKLPKIKSYSYPTVKDVTSRTVLEHNLCYTSPDVLRNMGFNFIRSEAAKKTTEYQLRERKRHSLSASAKKKTKKPRADPDPDEEYGPSQH